MWLCFDYTNVFQISIQERDRHDSLTFDIDSTKSVRICRGDEAYTIILR